jgi:hypothetical protein
MASLRRLSKSKLGEDDVTGEDMSHGEYALPDRV